MSTTVTFNGSSFSVPALGDTGWAVGPGNLSSYLIAIASGTLQTTGGTFTLSADVNFGASFGLVAPYLKSASSTIATAGVLRLAKGDVIDWKNNAGSGNNSLAVNGSDQITWNGSPLITGSSGITPVTEGGTGLATLTNHGVMLGQGTSNVAFAGPGASALPLVSNGASSDPSFQALTVPGGGTGQTTLTAHGVLVGAGASGIAATTTGTSGQALVSGGASADPAFGAVNLAGGSSIVIGVLPTVNGGTGSALTTPAQGDILYASAGNVFTVLTPGTSGQVLKTGGAAANPSWTTLQNQNATAPTVTVALTGTGTYTVPAGVIWLYVRIKGGGGGGGGSGTSPGAAAGGGVTTFGTSLLTANGGAAGPNGGGGAATGGDLNIPGQFGSAGDNNTTFGVGGADGGGAGGGAGKFQDDGHAGATNSGGGGAGGGSTTSTGGAAGGGGEGGYVEKLITSPSATYAYAVGAGGAAGTAGASGFNGGAGAAGYIIIHEHYNA